MALGKAWRYEPASWYDDEPLIVVHAETRGKAQSRVAGEVGVTFLEVAVRRLPAMDDKPITSWQLLVTESCGWAECNGCYRKIYPGGEDDVVGPYSWGGGDALGEAVAAAVEGPRGTAYCSAACYERHCKAEEPTA